MIRCNHCRTDNLDGSEYCDECGTKLSTTIETPRPTYVPPPPAQFITQVAPPPPPSFTKDSVTPKPATPYTPPPPPVHPPLNQSGNQGARQQSNQPQGEAADQSAQSGASGSTANNPPGGVQPPNQTTAFNGQTSGLRGSPGSSDSGRQQQVMVNEDKSSKPSVLARLIIQRGGKVGKEFPIVANESMIGRWDADGGIFPDIDLDQDDPEAKVSRRHARIQYLNNQFLIEDLGSTNGTFINRGPRLLPGTKQPLNNGDEIIVGKTFLRFVLN
jgi:hypothetical protein